MKPGARVRRQRALEMFAAGRTPNDAAPILGVSTRTARRYAEDLRDELRALSAERLSALNRKALDAANEALATLCSIMTDDDAPPMVRTTAAGRVLEISLRLHDA